MKKFFAAFSILGIIGVAGPAMAELRAEPIFVNQHAPTASGTNIRVSFSNDGDDVENVSRVELQARDEQGGDWHTVKTWDRAMVIKPHHRLALDYLPSSDGYLDPTLTQATYDLRVTASKADGDTITSASQAFEAAER